MQRRQSTKPSQLYIRSGHAIRARCLQHASLLGNVNKSRRPPTIHPATANRQPPAQIRSARTAYVAWQPADYCRLRACCL